MLRRLSAAARRLPRFHFDQLGGAVLALSPDLDRPIQPAPGCPRAAPACLVAHLSLRVPAPIVTRHRRFR
jgi:hypothetical protein